MEGSLWNILIHVGVTYMSHITAKPWGILSRERVIASVPVGPSVRKTPESWGEPNPCGNKSFGSWSLGLVLLSYGRQMFDYASF